MTLADLSRSPATSSRHPAALPPLLQALGWIGSDLLSTLAFAGLYALTRDARAATLLALAVGAGQILQARWRGRPAGAMAWTSLGLVAVFGAAALLTHDPRFVMVKPTLVYAAVGAAMLRRGWMERYLPPVARERCGDLTVVFGRLWAGLMFATAIANAAVAVLEPRAWPGFIATAPLTSKLALFALQYAVTRRMAVRRGRRTAA